MQKHLYSDQTNRHSLKGFTSVRSVLGGHHQTYGLLDVPSTVHQENRIGPWK